MAAAFLAAHSGIQPVTIENQAAYVGEWLKQIRQDKKLVITAAGAAQKASGAEFQCVFTGQAFSPFEPRHLSTVSVICAKIYNSSPRILSGAGESVKSRYANR